MDSLLLVLESPLMHMLAFIAGALMVTSCAYAWYFKRRPVRTPHGLHLDFNRLEQSPRQESDLRYTSRSIERTQPSTKRAPKSTRRCEGDNPSNTSSSGDSYCSSDGGGCD